MKLLLDTHALLWFVLDDPKLSDVADALITDLKNQIYVSPAVHWELAIKISVGKYALPPGISFGDFVEQSTTKNGFKILSIDPSHTQLLTTMPFHHRDPFDRLMVAQALAEGMEIVSADSILSQYSVKRHW